MATKTKRTNGTQLSSHVSEKTKKTYEAIRNELGCTGRDVLEKGVELLSLFVKAGQEGKNFAIVDSKGKTTEVEFKL
jgi:hypothetical protein